MEDGGWRMEDGGWRMEDGGWRMGGAFLVRYVSRYHLIGVRPMFVISASLHLEIDADGYFPTTQSLRSERAAYIGENRD